MNQKNTLYKAYLDKKKQSKIKDKMLKKYNISDDDKTIIINKNNNKVALFIWEIIGKIIKFSLYIAILILVTIGATVLLNEGLRNYIFEFCKSIIWALLWKKVNTWLIVKQIESI